MRIKSSIQNIVTGLFGQVVLLVTGFVSRTVFIHVLGATYLGVSGLFSNILTVLSLAELGIGQAIIYSLYKPIADHNEEKICSLMALYAKVYRILFCVVLVLGLSILPFLQYIIKDIDTIPHIRVIYVMYIINSASSYLFAYKGAFVTACQKNYIINTIGFVANILTVAAQIAALLLFGNYLVYLGVQIGMGILQNVFVYVYTNKLFPFLKEKNPRPLDAEEKEKIRKNVGALLLYKIGTIALNSTDNIIISAFIGIVTVGKYSNYLLLSTSVNAFLSTIFSNLTASIGNLNAQDDEKRKYFLFKTIHLATFWLYALCSVCLYVCMTPFIQLWLGDDYVLSNGISLIISVNVYIAGMLYAPFNYRQTMGLFVQGKLRPIISAILNIVLSIVFVQWWGLAGVLWGTAAARLTTNVWFDPYLVYKHGLHVSPWKYMVDYLAKAVVLVMTGGLCVLTAAVLPAGGFVGLLARAGSSFVICNAVFLLLYRRTEEFQYLLRVFLNIRKLIRGT